MFDLIVETMVVSLPALGILFTFVVLGMILFGSIIYACEGGTFQATEQYPEGEYLRPTVSAYGLEVSPFNSIPTAFYWVLTTATTGNVRPFLIRLWGSFHQFDGNF